MALQYWYPFNKDLRNYGLCKNPLLTYGTDTYGDGKVTRYSYKTGSTYSSLGYDKQSTNQISIAFWAKADSPAAWQDILSFGSYDNRIEITSTVDSATNTTKYCWYSNDSAGALLASGTMIFKMGNASWHHIVMVADGNTVTFYLDGVQTQSVAQTATVANAFGSSDLISLGIRKNSGGNKWVGYINDFRVYDHALSLKEISELSKGLAAHYKLKGMGRINYLNGASAYTVSNPLVRHSTDVSHMYDSYRYHSNLTATITTAGTYTFIMESDGVPSGHTTSGTTATQHRISMWLNDASAGTHYCWTSYGIGEDGRLYGTFSDLPVGTYQVRTNLYAADNVKYTVKMWNIKLVKGSYDVNDIWCPNSSDSMYSNLNLNTEYDCSGYKNNLTKQGVVEMVNDSARYCTCVDFNNTGYFYSKNFGLKTNQFTVSFWVNAPSTVSSQHFLFGTHSSWTGNGFSAWTDSGLNYSTIIKSDSESSHDGLSFSLTANTWQMITYVYTGTILIGYKNGVEFSRKTYGSGGVVQHPYMYLGNSWYNNAPTSEIDEACMSDFRMYATALSANDVKELYDNSVSLDNQYNMFAYDYFENNTNNLGKNGVMYTGNFSGAKVPIYDMKTKILNDGSAWARIHWLDVTNEKTWFTTAEVSECLGKYNRYSRMGIIDKYKANGQFEFMLTYPSLVTNVASGYTQLDYIEATGTQWINTGVTGNARWELDIKFKTGISHRQLMGYGGNGQEYWGVQVHGGYGVHEDGTLVGVAAGTRDTVIHSYGENSNYSIWVQNKSVNVSSSIDVSSHEYQLFCIMSNTSFGCHAKLYRCRCVQNGSLIRDFVPARRNSDGAIGLLDVVNNVFYGNSGSGVFYHGIALDSSVPLYNRWIQTSSPNATSVSGFKPISTAWTAHHAGIRKHGSSNVYDCDSGTTWYAPIGQTATWTDTQYIPAANGTSQTSTELWVRIDGLTNETQFNIYDDSMTAKSFMEL